MSFFITDALADTTAAATTAAAPTSASGLMSMLPLLIILVVFMYLMVIRPQSKRAKEQKSLLSSIQKGDEVMTIGGIMGKIEKISDNYVVVAIAEDINITIQKNAIASILPKGTMKTAKQD